jgi:hypothetical protein
LNSAHVAAVGDLDGDARVVTSFGAAGAPAWVEIVVGIAFVVGGVVWSALHEVGFTKWISGGRMSPGYVWVMTWLFVLVGAGLALYGLARVVTPLP